MDVSIIINTYYFAMCMYICIHVLHISYIINNEKKKDKCFTLFINYILYIYSNNFLSNNHAEKKNVWLKGKHR